ncbi:MAG: YitT family protein [Desulfotalea sp.]
MEKIKEETKCKTCSSHSRVEDVVAVITGTFFIALGIVFLQEGKIATGGITGLSLILENLTSWNFPVLFMVMNIPFYILAWVRMGRFFAVLSFFCAGIVSVVNGVLKNYMSLDVFSPYLSGVIGGFLMGVGMLMLFRHRASVGGFSVLALYLQERKIISAGKVQLILDSCILTFLALTVGTSAILPSALSIVVLNCVLIMNHKDGRYVVKY